jgi:hypothetical protein
MQPEYRQTGRRQTEQICTNRDTQKTDRNKHTQYRNTDKQTYRHTQRQMYRWYKQTGRCTVSHVDIIKDSGTDKQVEQTCQQTDKQKEKQTDKQRDQQPDRLNMDRQMYRCTNKHTDAWKDVKTKRRKAIETCRQTKKDSKQTDRHTRQAHIHTYQVQTAIKMHKLTDRQTDIQKQTDK